MKERCITRSQVFAIITLFALAFFPALSTAQVNVTTWHNDNWRTGQNIQEKILTVNNVNKSQFGLICRISVTGQIYGQPLVVANPAGGMTAYVATMQDYLYVFNIPANLTSQNCPTPTVVNLLANYPGEYPQDCCYLGPGAGKKGCAAQPTAIYNTTGVLGTPVIDTTTNTLYLVA